MTINLAKTQHGGYRPSLMFAILAGLALIIFAAAMVHLASLPTEEGKRKAVRQKMQQERIEMIASREGISTQQVLENEKTRGDHAGMIRKLRHDLQLALQDIDDAALEEALKGAEVDDIEEAMPYIYDRAVGYNNLYALTRLIDTGLACGYKSSTGKYGFDAAIRSGSDIYLETLIERDCDRAPTDQTAEISTQIRSSKYKYRVLLLPNATVDIEEKNELLMTALGNGSSEVALYLLEMGASPNAVSRSKNENALSVSLRRNKPLVALKLIEAGADTGKSPRGSWAVASALAFDHMGVARKILENEPDYIRSNEIEEQLMAGVFLSINKNTHNKVEFLIEHGVDVARLKNTGIPYLIKAIRADDMRLVQQLLEAGANPRQRHGVKTALGVAKNSSGAKSSEIVSLLLRHNATDDLLALIRAEKNIDANAQCSLGRKVAIKPGGISDSQQNKLLDDSNDPTEACAALVSTCLNQGFGSDDCMHSVPVCSGSNANKLCCPTEFRDNYFAARCAGLTVFETMRWLDQAVQR